MKKLLILDFGSQLTQLIARRVRELGVYCEIVPFHTEINASQEYSAIILSGSPSSVRDEGHPEVNLQRLIEKFPVLGICYGAQLMAHQLGGAVNASTKREYGKAQLLHVADDPLWEGIPDASQVWMSHSDSIVRLPTDGVVIGTTESIPVAAFRIGGKGAQTYGVQFHPEVMHTLFGKKLLENWLFGIAGLQPNWSMGSFIGEQVEEMRRTTQGEDVLLALSGGVDSSVAALLMKEAIGNRLHCFFIDNGLLRHGEYEQVLATYKALGLDVHGVDAKDRFYEGLRGVTDPEVKRKVIGKLFIEVFEEESKAHPEVRWLCQGTIYPDRIESVSVYGPSATIKSHHNVGGLPEKLHLKIIEPLKLLFKDEVRKVGLSLGLPQDILGRHPFPGPGLAIRIIGEVTPTHVQLLQQADAIYLKNLRDAGWYDRIWQAGAILLPIHTVGVMGDERTYERVIALRAVHSTDGMTAEFSEIPHELLGKISNEIINNVRGINRVVYDISSKPPATIEWE